MRALATILLATVVVGTVAVPATANADSGDLDAPQLVDSSVSPDWFWSEVGGSAVATIEISDESDTIEPIITLVSDTDGTHIGPLTTTYEYSQGLIDVYDTQVTIPIGIASGNWKMEIAPLTDEWGNTTATDSWGSGFSVGSRDSLQISSNPTVSGDTNLRGMLHVTTPPLASGMAGSVTYAWFRSGTTDAIPRATTDFYQSSYADIGHTLRAAVTYSNSAEASRTFSSTETAPITVPPRRPSVAIRGTVAVGLTSFSTPITPKLMADGQQLAFDLKYQWLVDSVPVVGAIGSTFVPTPPQGGHLLTVEVTWNNYPQYTISAGPNLSQTSVEVTSAPVTILKSFAKPSVRISGKIAAGHKLTVTAKKWGTSHVDVTYSWYIAKKLGSHQVKIATTHNRTLTIKKKWTGKSLSLVVTAKKVGYLDFVESRLNDRTIKRK